MHHRQEAGVRAALVACALVIAANSIVWAAPQQRTSGTRPLLEVPYLTQTGELCGGAALAMVLRYWGSRDVFAEDFAPLLDRSKGGIPVDALVSAARDRGGAAIETRDAASTSELRTALDLGRPAIALIEDTTDTYHYVVVIARTEAVVIFHDPARAPFRVMTVDQFDRAWSTTGRWMLVVLAKAHDAGVLASPPEVAKPHAGTCDALVTQNVVLAGSGHRAEADAGLTAALDLCPTESSAWRELAGLRFVQSRWEESSRLAYEAVRLAPDDGYAWRLVATSEFLQDHWIAALEAWNRVDQPHMDVVSVEGADRTRHPVIVAAVGLPARALLTADRFDRATRRLDALPVAASTRLRFQTDTEGRATVQAVVVERAARPRGLIPIGALAGSALIRHELAADVAGPTGSGELWSAAWRWSSGRPRVMFRLAMPAPNGLRGVLTVDAWWERESYRTSVTPLDDPTRIARRSVRASFADWAPHQLRWHAGAALDRIDSRDFIAIDGLIDKRFMGDRVAVGAAGTWWSSASGNPGFGTTSVTAAWRSARSTVSAWSAGLGVASASTTAPMIVWPGAGTGQARDMLLRAHPLLDRGAIVGAAFGRRLAFASMEYRPARLRAAAGRVSPAAFVDAARTWDQNVISTRPFLVDVGGGLRVHTSGLAQGFRVDVAYGVRDGRRALSAGWQKRWPNP